MLKALYYPHTDITNPTIIKNALLLWDEIETIVPRKGWTPKRLPGDRTFNQAVDFIVRPVVSTPKERQDADHALRDLLNTGLIDRILRRSPDSWRDERYLIYPQKFLKETWQRLQQRGIAEWVEHKADYGLPPAVGFLMMSILAEARAGTQVQRVTDQAQAYSWLAEHRAHVLGSQHITGLDASQVAPDFDRLVTLSLTALDARNIPMNRLLNLRKREDKHGGTDLRKMRRRFLKSLHDHIKRLSEEARTESDVRELTRQYTTDLEDDLKDLKKDLGVASLKTFFTKEIGAAAVIAAGCFVTPIPGLTALASSVSGIGVIPLLKSAVEFRGARRDALRKHDSSWLYLAKHGRFTVL